MTADPEATSLTLLGLLKTNDADGWRRFSEQYGPLVYQWCRRRGVEETASADICQEVFTAVLRNIAAFRKEQREDTFRGWLWMIAHNKIRDHFRLLARTPQSAGGSSAQLALAQLAAEDSLSHCEISNGREGRFHRGLAMIQAEFEPRTWQAFWRAVVDGQDTATIASELKLSPASVRQAKSRVLRRLRQMLGDH
ncbi:MAG: sigma-70 family RNA polymerase sigma factor [Planctomycetales bacterium]|nr:sigma-70 family RNA polymerase sigma factor [Planctomycetales bacterium]